jgi:hypothetical protein
VTEVSDLLAQSMAAHQAALPSSKKQRRPAGWKASLRLARELRVRADALDPKHDDPAWAAEGSKTPRGYDTHTLLMAFYEGKLR